MAYYPDLSPYTYSDFGKGDHTLNVGWLDIIQPYPEGSVSDAFLECLWGFCRWHVVTMRGFHLCQFCNVPTETVPTIQRGDEVFKAGYAEIRVFGKDDIEYASPDLIYHYINEHGYLPPQEFIDAVLTSPFPDSQEYRKLAIQFAWGKKLYTTWDIVHKYRSP